ncbi:hypothetical protein [Curtobacterium sp. L1-20]|uniref:hypothetical protein n=1 Tax=Curtobacterium sp. L1-20 TaxID=3138181 RepID=UPI003B51FE76
MDTVRVPLRRRGHRRRLRDAHRRDLVGDRSAPGGVMTAVRSQVNAATVPLGSLDVLEVGTMLTWNGWTAAHGDWYSPLQGEATPDVFALISVDEQGYCVNAVEYDVDDAQPRVRGTLPGTFATLGDVLDALDALVAGADVLRFATGRELDFQGDRELPAVGLWTGPAIPAWLVPLTDRRQDLRGFRIDWQGGLSHRVLHGGQTPGGETLTATQGDDDTWVLAVNGTARSELRDHLDHHTLAQILAWMNAEAHTLLERTPFESMDTRPFAVIDPDGVGALTVRMW